MMRAAISAPPPAEKPTITLTGWSGYCACACAARHDVNRPASVTRSATPPRFMMLLPPFARFGMRPFKVERTEWLQLLKTAIILACPDRQRSRHSALQLRSIVEPEDDTF